VQQPWSWKDRRVDRGAGRRHGGRFNLNSVVKWDDQTKTFIGDEHQTEIFRKLLVDLDIDQRYADLLVDWIDPDIAPSGSRGGEDTLYLSQVPPYARRIPSSRTLRVARLAGIRSRELPQDRALRPALPYDTAQCLHRQRPGAGRARNDPTNENEFRGMDLTVQRREGLLSCQDVYTGDLTDPLKVEVLAGVEEKVVLVPSAHQHSYWHCGVRFVQSPLSSKAPTKSAPCSAVSEVNDG
jgi:hypothetical protein